MKLEPNRPFETTEPTIVLDAGLRPGRYRIQLVVIGKSGRKSEPVEVVITIEPAT